MSVRFPVPESKESQGKHITKEDDRPHRLTGVQVSMAFSDKASYLEACYIQHSFCCIYCTAFSPDTTHAELLLRFVLNPHNSLLCNKNPNSSRQ